MLESIPIFLQSLSIAFLIQIVVLLVFALVKYFKTMEKPPFWVYICGGFILFSLYDIFFMKYSQFSLEEIPLAILKVMAYFLVLLGVLELNRILMKTTG